MDHAKKLEKWLEKSKFCDDKKDTLIFLWR